MFFYIFLILRGAVYFVQNDMVIILPDDKDRAVSCRTRATHSWRQVKSLETQMLNIFSLFTMFFFKFINSIS